MAWQAWIGWYTDASCLAVGMALRILLQSTFVLGIGLVAGRLVRFRGAAVQSAVYRTTLATVLLCPAANVLWGAAGMEGWALARGGSLVAKAPAGDGESTVVGPPSPRAATSTPGTWERVGTPAGLAEPPAELSGAGNSTPLALKGSAAWSVRSGTAGRLAGLFTAVWGAVAVVLLVRLAVAHARAAQLCTTACEASTEILAACRAEAERIGASRPRVLVSPFLSSPCLVGLFRPVILLPESDADTADIRDLLVHELAHVLRRDALWNLLRRLSTAVLCFQPLLWRLGSAMARSAEEVCDDYVLHLGGDRSHYARRLVEVAERYQPLGAGMGVVAIRSLVGQRVLRILDASRRLSWSTRRSVRLGLASAGIAGALAAGLVSVNGQSPAARPPSPPQPGPGVNTPAKEKTMLVEGRVVDREGNAIGQAHVAVLLEEKPRLGDTAYLTRPADVAYQGVTTVDGRFECRVPQTSSTQHAEASVVAIADGYGIRWCSLDVDQPAHRIRIALEPEYPIRGRLVDSHGAAAAGVAMRVLTVWHGGRGAVSCETAIPLAASPPPVVSDGEGRFVLRGIAWDSVASAGAYLQIDDKRFARQRLGVEAQKAAPNQDKVYILPPPQVLEGTVVDEQTGRPLPGAFVTIGSSDYDVFILHPSATVPATTDVQGRFRVHCYPGKWSDVVIYPAAGSPYPAWHHHFAWPPASGEHPIRIAVPQGVLVRGSIREADSGEPVIGAAVEHRPRRADNPHYRQAASDAAQNRRVLTGADGRFELAVMPGPGCLLVRAATPDYLHPPISSKSLDHEQSAVWLCPDALAHVAPRPGDPPIEVALEVRRGVTVRGRVEGPDGKPVRKAVLVSATYRPDGFHYQGDRLAVTDGQFQLPGCDPQQPQQVFFLDAQAQCGATMMIDAKQASQGLTVRLQPCGSATVRLIDEKGHPYANHPLDRRPYLAAELAVIPGAAPGPNPDSDAVAEEIQDALWMISADRQRYHDLTTDGEGRVTLPTLIPDAPYCLLSADPYWKVKRRFQARPGESLRLPDVVLSRPVLHP